MTTCPPRPILFALALSVLATGLFAQAPTPVEFPAPSPASTLKQRVGLTDITVEYSRPGVKGRVIFGGLEPWGEVWRAGANSATTVTATFGAPPVGITVTLAGTGTGTVASAPAGIACAPTCTATFPMGTSVTLTATPTAPSTFSGWSGGGCSDGLRRGDARFFERSSQRLFIIYFGSCFRV